ncbi:MAG: hypothetical protein ABIR76_04980 [Polaromonas sp.]
MTTPMRSLCRLALGVSLFLTGASCFSGTAGGQFGVQINLTGVNNACTSTSGSSSVQVTCNSNVFVNIVQVRTLGDARFMPGYRPTRDSLLPDYCRNEQSRLDPGARFTCRLDDQRQVAMAGEEIDDGWEIENRRYALDPEAAEMEKQARIRLQDDRGTVTALHLAYAGKHAGSVEMLVSF